MKRCVCGALLLLLLLSGCSRVRRISDPARADTVLTTAETAAPETDAPETSEPPETTQPRTPSDPAEPTEPPEAAVPPSVTEPAQPAPTAPQTPEPAAAQVSAAVPAASQADAPAPAAPAEAPATEPPETEPPETEDRGVTVIYDPNGGDDAAVSTRVLPGETYGPQPACSRRGYRFAGWWTDPEGGEAVTPDSAVTRTEDHSLYAHWAPLENAEVFFDGNGGRVKPYEERLELAEGEAYGPLPTPIREGYDFLGWFTDPAEGGQITPESVFTGTEDQRLYAHWSYNAPAFWRFTLQNRTQQIYLCQQATVYCETAEDHVAQIWCPLITDTGSVNIAANRSDPVTDDDWVLAKNPQVVIKCVASLAEAGSAAQAIRERFPACRPVIVTAAALGDGPEGLYARLALAKALYPDWYTDVDPDRVASELAVSARPVIIY